MDLYLITGFLGAGKTTFLKEFVSEFKNKRIWLIINEFGKTGIDGTLVKEIGAVLSEINNGSIFCACRLDRFEDELKRAISDKPDIIIVEASGLADPTNVRTVLSSKDFEQINYKGSICLIDTPRLEKIIHTARVCPKQIMISSLILLNKTDIATNEQIKKTYELIKNPFAVIKETKFGKFNSDWLKYINPLNSQTVDNKPDIQLQKYLIEIDSKFTISQLKSLLKMVIEDTWRIKGFVFLENRKLLVDCVGVNINIKDYNFEHEQVNKIILLAGAGMPLRKAIKNAIKWYNGLVWEVKE